MPVYGILDELFLTHHSTAATTINACSPWQLGYVQALGLGINAARAIQPLSQRHMVTISTKGITYSCEMRENQIGARPR